MIKKWLFWIYILIFVFILGSAIYFWSFIFPNVVLPTAQFFWAIYRIFASINQRVYWLLLVGIIVLLAYRIIFSIPKDIQDKYVTELDKPVRREQFWLETISNAIKNGEGSRKFLRRQLGQLFLSASNLSALSKAEDIETALLNLQPPLPTNLLLLFKKGGDGHKKCLQTVDFTFARDVFHRMRWRRRGMAEVTYKDIDAILKSMEDYLEIDHEN